MSGVVPPPPPTTSKAAFVGDPGPGLALYLLLTQDFVLGFHMPCLRHCAIGSRVTSHSISPRAVWPAWWWRRLIETLPEVLRHVFFLDESSAVVCDHCLIFVVLLNAGE